MNITAVMVVRDEEYFLPLSLTNILKHVDNVYILDTGSKDNTLTIISDFRDRHPSRIAYDQRDFGGRYSFDNGTIKDVHNNRPDASTGAYREMEARNFAMDRADAIFNPDWIVRMDADESFDKRLFEVIRSDPPNPCIGFSTELPTHYDPVALNRRPEDMHNWSGHILHDPHFFCWNRRKTKVRWQHPPNSHVTLNGPGFGNVATAIIMHEHVHFHWHRVFGPKSIYTILYWERVENAKKVGNHAQIPYGWADVTGCKEVNRENIHKTETYKTYTPQRFDSQGRFIVPRIVVDAFRKTSVHCGAKIDDHIMAAWKSFLVYENV